MCAACEQEVSQDCGKARGVCWRAWLECSQAIVVSTARVSQVVVRGRRGNQGRRYPGRVPLLLTPLRALRECWTSLAAPTCVIARVPTTSCVGWCGCRRWRWLRLCQPATATLIQLIIIITARATTSCCLCWYCCRYCCCWRVAPYKRAAAPHVHHCRVSRHSLRRRHPLPMCPHCHLLCIPAPPLALLGVPHLLRLHAMRRCVRTCTVGRLLHRRPGVRPSSGTAGGGAGCRVDLPAGAAGAAGGAATAAAAAAGSAGAAAVTTSSSSTNRRRRLSVRRKRAPPQRRRQRRRHRRWPPPTASAARAPTPAPAAAGVATSGGGAFCRFRACCCTCATIVAVRRVPLPGLIAGREDECPLLVQPSHTTAAATATGTASAIASAATTTCALCHQQCRRATAAAALTAAGTCDTAPRPGSI